MAHEGTPYITAIGTHLSFMIRGWVNFTHSLRAPKLRFFHGFFGGLKVEKILYKVGPLPDITRVITPITRVFSPQLPNYFRPFRTPFRTGFWAHLVYKTYITMQFSSNSGQRPTPNHRNHGRKGWWFRTTNAFWKDHAQTSRQNWIMKPQGKMGEHKKNHHPVILPELNSLERCYPNQNFARVSWVTFGVFIPLPQPIRPGK